MPAATFVTLLALAASSLAPQASAAPSPAPLKSLASSFECSTAYVKVSAQANNTHFRVSQPDNQLNVTNIVRELFAVGSNYTASVTDDTRTVKGRWRILTKTCTPTDWNGDVQILTHGVGANRHYWEYPDNLKYSYIASATAKGRAVISYDRLGVGASDHPDGINVVQAPLELEVLHQLVKHFKNEDRFANATRWIGVGHSFGSLLTSGIAVKYPNDFDSIVLTGFASADASKKYGPVAFQAFSATIAVQQDPTHFMKYANDTSYWAVQDQPHALSGFFDSPGTFPTGVFDYFTTTGAGSFTYGEVLTMGAIGEMYPAVNYKGDVLVVTGQHDLPFCGGNCYQESGNLVAAAQPIFPNAKGFSTYIPANTAHAAFQHNTAPAVFAVIDKWLKGTYN